MGGDGWWWAITYGGSIHPHGALEEGLHVRWVVVGGGGWWWWVVVGGDRHRVRVQVPRACFGLFLAVTCPPRSLSALYPPPPPTHTHHHHQPTNQPHLVGVELDGALMHRLRSVKVLAMALQQHPKVAERVDIVWIDGERPPVEAFGA